MITAVAYLRTSSATNIADNDSGARQRSAIAAYAAAHGIEIVHEFWDMAVSGADRIDERKGFNEMLAYMAGNGARMIIVENASRFARDLIVQETGYMMLKSQGMMLIASDDPDAFTNDTPTAVLIRQILGAVSQFEKANLVAKMKSARDRQRAATGRCEGPKQAPEIARALAGEHKAAGLSLRAISARLAQAGFLAPSGEHYGAESIKRMLPA